MLNLWCFLALAAGVSCSSVGYGLAQVYQGTFTGGCNADGFYYNDGSSFVMCSNGNSYVQPCAPGSRNSDASVYQSGNTYSYRDFCDVNLVDYGYTLYNRDSGYGSGSHGSSYGSSGSHGSGYGSSGSHGSGFGSGGSHGSGYGSSGSHGSGYKSSGSRGNSYGPPHGGGSGYESQGHDGDVSRGYGDNQGYGSHGNSGYGSPPSKSSSYYKVNHYRSHGPPKSNQYH